MSDLLSVVVSKEKKTAVDQWRACTQTPINNDVTKICRVTMLGIVLFPVICGLGKATGAFKLL